MFSKPTKKQLYRQVEKIAEAYCNELEFSNKMIDEYLEAERRLTDVENEYDSYRMEYGSYPSMTDYDAAKARIQYLEGENDKLQTENNKLYRKIFDLEEQIAEIELKKQYKELGIEL